MAICPKCLRGVVADADTPEDAEILCAECQPETVVVNVKHDVFDVYIGRRYHGSTGYFGNPFKIGRDGDRDEVIAKYKRYFWKRVNEDPVFRRNVMALKGKRLGCWCKTPEQDIPCHGDVIKAWLDAGCLLK